MFKVNNKDTLWEPIRRFRKQIRCSGNLRGTEAIITAKCQGFASHVILIIAFLTYFDLKVTRSFIIRSLLLSCLNQDPFNCNDLTHQATLPINDLKAATEILQSVLCVKITVPVSFDHFLLRLAKTQRNIRENHHNPHKTSFPWQIS